VELHSDASTDKRQFFIDAIELRDGELYVAGHTDVSADSKLSPELVRSEEIDCYVALDEFELRLTPRDERSALEVARRSNAPKSRKANPRGG
jgi:hypothetical protein